MNNQLTPEQFALARHFNMAEMMAKAKGYNHLAQGWRAVLNLLLKATK